MTSNHWHWFNADHITHRFCRYAACICQASIKEQTKQCPINLEMESIPLFLVSKTIKKRARDDNNEKTAKNGGIMRSKCNNWTKKEESCRSSSAAEFDVHFEPQFSVYQLLILMWNLSHNFRLPILGGSESTCACQETSHMEFPIFRFSFVPCCSAKAAAAVPPFFPKNLINLYPPFNHFVVSLDCIRKWIVNLGTVRWGPHDILFLSLSACRDFVFDKPFFSQYEREYHAQCKQFKHNSLSIALCMRAQNPEKSLPWGGREKVCSCHSIIIKIYWSVL